MLETIARILVPVDFSAPSDLALRAARALAKRYDASVILLHVLAPDARGASEIAGDADRSMAMRELAMRAEAHKGEGAICEVELVVGDPRREIVRYADAVKPDTIVLATHGQTGLAWVFLGQVAEHVVRLATCPVIMIPRGATVSS